MRAQHLSRLFALLLLLGLLGCGFHPAYQAQRPTAGGANMFAEIEIGPIYERAGQLLRQELQRRLEGTGGSVHKSYVLNTNLAMHDEGVAIEFGSSAASRLRVVGVATWSLVGLGGNQSVVASGWAKSVDGFDQIDPQYFYSDLQHEQSIKRISGALADEIVLQLAAQLNKAPSQE